jgi:hypothetical protein
MTLSGRRSREARIRGEFKARHCFSSPRFYRNAQAVAADTAFAM